MAKRKTTSLSAPEGVATQWQNRIVRVDMEVDPDSIVDNEANWRVHPDAQRDAARSVLAGPVGWVQSVVVNLREDKAWPVSERGKPRLVDGHMRVRLAQQSGQRVPVTYVNLSPDEEALVLASFDPIGDMARTDAAALDALVMASRERFPDLLDDKGTLIAALDIAASAAPKQRQQVESSTDEVLASRTTRMMRISTTEEQHVAITRAVERLRANERDASISEGRALELICADWMAG